jgi:hypothetical protein
MAAEQVRRAKPHGAQFCPSEGMASFGATVLTTAARSRLIWPAIAAVFRATIADQ